MRESRETSASVLTRTTYVRHAGFLQAVEDRSGFVNLKLLDIYESGRPAGQVAERCRTRRNFLL
ncbi:protein of unknown function (plasmid) [Cupriavidus taiwanensis]|nr:hypothetical protein CBM2598_U50029 [Cupriavidus taiwanensis]SPD37703.1 protein of unknown function [Cupriavidus taiwanensis]